MGKYFGTDGFRGEAGITLTADHAYKVGRFLGWYYNALRERNGDTDPARIVIGKDTRRSSYMFEYSLVAGLTASGADAYLLHVTTTPSVAYIARVDDFDCGIMISASHNPYYDNGIKLIDCYGEKMPEETLLLVEDYIDGKLHVFDKDWPELPFAHREHIGCTVDYVAGRNRYMGYLISLGNRTDENSQLHFLFLSDWSCHISCSYDFKRHCLPANSLLITLHQCLFQNRKKRTLLQKRYAVGKLSFHSSYIFKCIALCGRCLLKKNIFAVCDLEVDYALNFMDYLNHKKNIPFEIQAFTNVESLIAYGKMNHIELLLISYNYPYQVVPLQ